MEKAIFTFLARTFLFSWVARLLTVGRWSLPTTTDCLQFQFSSGQKHILFVFVFFFCIIFRECSIHYSIIRIVCPLNEQQPKSIYFLRWMRTNRKQMYENERIVLCSDGHYSIKLVSLVICSQGEVPKWKKKQKQNWQRKTEWEREEKSEISTWEQRNNWLPVHTTRSRPKKNEKSALESFMARGYTSSGLNK